MLFDDYFNRSGYLFLTYLTFSMGSLTFVGSLAFSGFLLSVGSLLINCLLPSFGSLSVYGFLPVSGSLLF